MLIKEAEFERSELIVEMAKVYEVVTQMRVRLIALILILLRVMHKQQSPALLLWGGRLWGDYHSK